MNFLTILYYLLFFIGLGLYSVPTSSEAIGEERNISSSQTGLSEVSVNLKASFFLSKLSVLQISEIRTREVRSIFDETRILLKLDNLKLIISEETKWLSLLYLKENHELTIDQKGLILSQEHLIFFKHPELVDSWKLLENSARRTDIKVLKFFDDPAVVASRQDVISRNLHKTFPDIPIEELTAIRHYSSDAYVGFNEALRKGVLTDEYKAFEELLNSGMSKLPKFNGEKVYRGCGIQESNLAHKWVIGQDIVFSDFKSTSTSMGKASKFLKGDVYYEILNPKGVNICDISCHPNELEVLFQSKAKFKVKNIKEDAVMYDEAFEPINAKKITLEFVGYE